MRRLLLALFVFSSVVRPNSVTTRITNSRVPDSKSRTKLSKPSLRFVSKRCIRFHPARSKMP